jgi:hypothetical protein
MCQPNNEIDGFVMFFVCAIFFCGAIFCYLELNTGKPAPYNVRRCWTGAGLFCIGVPVVKMLIFLF